MTKLLLILLFNHWIADFLLQPRVIATNKSKSFGYLMLHVGIQYVVVTLALVLYGYDFTFANTLSIFNAMIHGMIDWNIWKLYKLSVYFRDRDATEGTWKYYEDYFFYVTIGLDQMLHGMTLIVLASILT